MPQTEEEHNLGMAEMDEEVERVGEKEKMVRQTPRLLRDQYDVRNIVKKCLKPLSFFLIGKIRNLQMYHKRF